MAVNILVIILLQSLPSFPSLSFLPMSLLWLCLSLPLECPPRGPSGKGLVPTVVLLEVVETFEGGA
jgi:hypothetical protein